MMKPSTIPHSRNRKDAPLASPQLGRATIPAITLITAAVLAGACTSSSTTGAGGAGGSTSSTSSSPNAESSSTSTSTGTGGSAPVPAAAFFRGTLAQSVADSKSSSDPFFDAVKAQALAAGDTGHDALLGTTHLGTTLNQFVGLDTWSSDANMDAVYSDPQVQAFGANFYAAPPEFETFYLTTFYQWGDADSADASSPHYFVFVRGRFNDTPDQIKPTHDQIVQGAETQLKAAGMIGHNVYAGRQDSQDALLVDVWSSDTNIDSVYSNPELASAVSALFDATGPNFGVYSSTDWVTW